MIRFILNLTILTILGFTSVIMMMNEQPSDVLFKDTRLYGAILLIVTFYLARWMEKHDGLPRIEDNSSKFEWYDSKSIRHNLLWREQTETWCSFRRKTCKHESETTWKQAAGQTYTSIWGEESSMQNQVCVRIKIFWTLEKFRQALNSEYSANIKVAGSREIRPTF